MLLVALSLSLPVCLSHLKLSVDRERREGQHDEQRTPEVGIVSQNGSVERLVRHGHDDALELVVDLLDVDVELLQQGQRVLVVYVVGVLVEQPAHAVLVHVAADGATVSQLWLCETVTHTHTHTHKINTS